MTFPSRSSWKRDILRRCRFTPYRKGTGPTFSLVTWDAHKRDHLGKDMIGYELRMHESGITTILFTDEDIDNSPMHCLDSDASVAGVMHFLTLRPGDTDAEFFANDSEIAKDYRASHAEALSCAVFDRFGDA